MSDVSPFHPRTMLLLVVGGVAAFMAFLATIAFEPDIRGANDPGAHVLSKSAVGYAGLAELLRRMDGVVTFQRSEMPDKADTLTILTPELYNDSDVIDERVHSVIDSGQGSVLIILPKWNVVADPGHKGWVRAAGIADPGAVAALPKAHFEAAIARVETPADALPLRLANEGFDGLPLPRTLQIIKGDELRPVLQTTGGDILLAQVRDEPAYVLSDPDLINNMALADRRNARFAIDLIDLLAPGAARVVTFDLIPNGFSADKSALRALLSPPMLAGTLALFALGLLAGLRASARFAPVERVSRVYDFGHNSLLENSADLVRRTRNEDVMATGYIEVVRRIAAHSISAGRRVQADDIDTDLDAYAQVGEPTFSSLASALYQAGTRREMLVAARELRLWKETNIG